MFLLQMLNSKDFIKNTTYNKDTKNQLWCSVIADSHDIWCGCETPFAHLLASIFPPGHKDRKLSIEEILNRDYKEWHSGGDAEESHGLPDGNADLTEKGGQEEEGGQDIIKDEELEELISAAELAEAR